MHYSIREIAEITGGRIMNSDVANTVVEYILLDSRQVIFPSVSIFIAMKGSRYDGHTFIAELYKNGLRQFLISDENFDSTPFSGANFILVNQTLGAFQKLAKWHRQQFKLPVIGITGSKGKTVLKEWLYQLMHPEYHIVRSPGTFNSQTGVPLSVLQINSDHQLGLFEADISQMNEMKHLSKIIDPHIGVLTNAGKEKSEEFPNAETELEEKIQLFKNANTVIYCCDDARIDTAFTKLIQNVRNIKMQFFTWSALGKTASLNIKRIAEENTGKNESRFFVQLNNKESNPEPFELSIPFVDEASIQNAMHCCSVMVHLGYNPELIAERMAKLEPVAMMLELKEGINGCTVIHDSYNSDLASLHIALNFVEQQCPPIEKQNKSRTLVLSDIMQSGQNREKLYAEVAKLIAEKGIDRFIGIGHEVSVINNYLSEKAHSAFFETTADMLEHFQELDFRQEAILLKGAREFGFEQIANRLMSQIHQTILEVNLSALLKNLRLYQSYIQADTRLMVMVKARAYGSGSIQVAKLLEFHHVDYLGVAFADEGVELREAGIQSPIIVMNPEEATFEVLLRFRLEPAIYSIGILKKFISFLYKQSVLPENYVPIIHLKLDTGMRRLGFEENDLSILLDLLKFPMNNNSTKLSVKSIFSHLVGSESEEHDEFTQYQVESFTRMSDFLSGGLGYRPFRHILNSAGILRFPEFQMDMVRLGLGLYGIDSSGLIQGKLQTVNTLKTTISQIKNLNPGDTVGYARMGKVLKPMRTATLSIGYADGLVRKAGNGRFSVLIRSKCAPLIGNVCMDMVMADISGIPEAKEGDTAIIFGKSDEGEELRVEELASVLDTIPYEVFTSVSTRVKRVYTQK